SAPAAIAASTAASSPNPQILTVSFIWARFCTKPRRESNFGGTSALFCRCGGDRWPERQLDHNRRALTLDRVDLHLAAVQANEAPHDGQTKPGAAARAAARLAGERLESARHEIGRHPRALVGDRKLDGV